jgi:hypothetical protein
MPSHQVRTPASGAKPPYSGEKIEVPLSVEKKASSALNPLNKKLPGESKSDWYTED